MILTDSGKPTHSMDASCCNISSTNEFKKKLVAEKRNGKERFVWYSKGGVVLNILCTSSSIGRRPASIRPVPVAVPTIVCYNTVQYSGMTSLQYGVKQQCVPSEMYTIDSYWYQAGARIAATSLLGYP